MNWRDKTILITGGTGSFGRKFTEVMLNDYHPRKLIILSRDEEKQRAMKDTYDHPTLRFFIGDIRERRRMFRAFEGVDIVVHAAALKQVPSCEYNPLEAVRTNIDGAANIIEAALDQKVERLIAISTDKAVNPVNLYGGTKLVMEKLFVQANSYKGRRDIAFSCTRYGNVIGSRGSIVPVFQKQRETGRLTITDKRMTRFWLTLDEGVRFVIHCLEIMRGGEIFVPKIPSMRIIDLADSIAPECEQIVTGIRPGEKLHEVLISRDEARHTLEFDDMFVVKPLFRWWGGNDSQAGEPVPEGFEYRSDTNPQKVMGEMLNV